MTTMTAKAIDIPHDTYQLDNGLNVILHTDHTLPQVVVNLWYGVGSKDEQDGRSGFAHLFEHLMFMGTVHLPESGFDERMEAFGGWNNAWTSEDATDYYEAGPNNLLETFLWMEGDRMRDLGRAMTQEKLDLQRDVVRNERRQSVEDTPYGIVWETLNHALYPPTHPYGHTVIGTHEDLMAATLDDVTGFFGTWYVPNNASLVIAGDFDKAEAKKWVNTYFGGIERTDLPTRRAFETQDMPVRALVEETDNVSLPMTLLTWHTPAAFEPGDAAYDLVASVLGSGDASRLYHSLVYERSIAIEIEAWQYSQKLGSVFGISAKPAEGHTIEELETAILEEVAKLAAEGPKPMEMERAKNQYEVDFVGSLEGLQNRASLLNRYRYMAGESGFIDKDLQRYRDIEASQVQTAAAKLTTARVCRIRVRPEAPTSEGEK
jgi:predicted Zn-dependent peptidase